MGGARSARARWLWPVVATTWLALAGTAVLGGDDGPNARSAEPDRSRPAEVEAPADDERLEPPRGIRPPWREPLIPEQRRDPERKRRPLPA